jgi:hypothetical protein
VIGTVVGIVVVIVVLIVVGRVGIVVDPDRTFRLA